MVFAQGTNKDNWKWSAVKAIKNEDGEYKTDMSTAKHFKTTLAEMKKDKLSGQWYTPTSDHARSYASGLFSKVKEVKVTPQELAAFYRYKDNFDKLKVLKAEIENI